MQRSVTWVNTLIETEMKTISADRIVIGGFSQGAAIAVLATLVSPLKFAGCMCLSGWLGLRGVVLEKKVCVFYIFFVQFTKFLFNPYGSYSLLNSAFTLHCTPLNHQAPLRNPNPNVPRNL